MAGDHAGSRRASGSIARPVIGRQLEFDALIVRAVNDLAAQHEEIAGTRDEPGQ